MSQSHPLAKARLSIADYREGRLDLAHLALRLETVLDLDEVSESKREEFQRHWMVIEEINAVTSDAGHLALSRDQTELVDRSLNAIETLIADASGQD